MRLPTVLLLPLALVSLATCLPAQKVLCDTGIYTHNWQPQMNNIDPSGQGVAFFVTNKQIHGGPPRVGDAVRKCWTHDMLRGGQESLNGGLRNIMLSAMHVTTDFNQVYVGQISVISVADPRGRADVCVAPFTVNPLYLVGGYNFFFGWTPLPPGAWLMGFYFLGQGRIVPVTGRNNGGAELRGALIYELQHGYNGTARNQQYLTVVSVNEIQYPQSGGMAQGDPFFGAATWGSGVINSYSRIMSYSTGFMYTLPGQSSEGNADGIELDNGIAFIEPALTAGRHNGTRDCFGRRLIDYGAGGRDWVAGNCDRVNLRVTDYVAAARNDPASCGFNGTGGLYAEFFWSRSGSTFQPNTIGTGDLDGVVVPLDLGMRFDQTTLRFNTNPSAVSTVKFGSEFSPGVTTSRSNALWADGAWPSFCRDEVDIGVSTLPEGDRFRLDLCNPKAGSAGLVAGTDFYVSALLWDPVNVRPRETSTAIRIHIF